MGSGIGSIFNACIERKISKLVSLERSPRQVKILEPCLLDAVGLSGILKGKQNLGVTFNFDKQDVIDFTKFSKMTMCRASEANS